MTRLAVKSGGAAIKRTLKRPAATRKPPAGAGAWLPGLVMGPASTTGLRLFIPRGVALGERLPLMVMLHGCGQDATSFAASTRMNRLAQQQRFLVLYPEQSRLANSQGCWNWFETDSGRAQAEAALIMKSVDQVCLLQPADKAQVAIAGLSAGASMAALVATRYPDRFKAVVMHSGVPPGAAHSGLSALRAMQGLRATTSGLPRPRHAPSDKAAEQVNGQASEPVCAPSTDLPTSPAAPAIDWPPLLAIHGGADGIVVPQNSQAAVQAWALHAGAMAGPARLERRGKRYEMSVTDFKSRRGTAATLVTIDRLAHAWSGGAPGKAFSDAHGPDASRMAWAFAARQFRA